MLEEKKLSIHTTLHLTWNMRTNNLIPTNLVGIKKTIYFDLENAVDPGDFTIANYKVIVYR